MADPKSPKALLTGVIERAWRDPAYKSRLLAEPAAVLAAAGLPVPAGRRVKVVEETDTISYLVLPPAPGEAGLSDAELDAVAAASGTLCLQTSQPTVVRPTLATTCQV